MSTATLDMVVALIIAVGLHELAPGVAEGLVGAKTGQQSGRLTLNPLKHVDPFGTLLLPALLAAGQLMSIGRIEFLYGWAKPVPVNPMQLQLNGQRHPRQLMALVAAAGPLANFALALLGGYLLSITQANVFLTYFIIINLALGLFNLLPVPPMDGGGVAV